MSKGLTVREICSRYGLKLIYVNHGSVTGLKWYDEEKYGFPPSDAVLAHDRKAIYYDLPMKGRSSPKDAILHELCHFIRGDRSDVEFERDEGGLMVLQYALILACREKEDLLKEFSIYGWIKVENGVGFPTQWSEEVTRTEKWLELQRAWIKAGALTEGNQPTWQLPDLCKLTPKERKFVTEW